MQRVILFSGGKTSAYMTIHEYKQGDLVIFCDTGREHPKTYKFINDFEANENIPLVRVKYYDSENPFKHMLERRKYKILPNRTRRFCTEELKVKTAKRYLRNLGIRKFENLIGFRFDEPQRVKRHVDKFKNVKTLFPLYDKQIDKQIVNHYWSSKPYNLEIPSILGNCTLCFMKGKNAIINILTVYPELADEWINDEKEALKNEIKGTNSGRRYFPDITMEQLRNIAQNNLFKETDLSQITPAFDCACTA